MKHRIDLHDDTSILLNDCAMLTGLNVSDLINRLLSAHLSELYELLALANAFPHLYEQAANLLISFGPEPLAQGIDGIAPVGYETLSAQFQREMNKSTTTRLMARP